MVEATQPKRFYKYRGFSDLTLAMLIRDVVYFADPTTFNDPLDTKPAVHTDVGNKKMKNMLVQMIEDRTKIEISETMKEIN